MTASFRPFARHFTCGVRFFPSPRGRGWRAAANEASASLVKRFSRLPASDLPFSSQRNVGQRCDPMTCRPHAEAVRVRKHWPGSAEGTSCAAAEDALPARPASGCSVQHLPTGNGRVDQKHSALRCVPLTFIPFRGGELAQKRPEGWPEWIRASSLSAQGRAVSEPRSQLA